MEVRRQWDLIAAKLTPEARVRFWNLVGSGEPDDCWPWLGKLNHLGYGNFSVAGIAGQIGAHRIVYGLTNGGIPKGLHCLHTCDNRKCVNPAHLYVGTHQDNMRDMMARGRHNNGQLGRTHCKYGHPFDMPGGKGIHRICDTCRREREADIFAETEMRRVAKRHTELLAVLPPTINELIERVGVRRAFVVCRHFGVFGHPATTQEETAARLRLTRERVRQLRNSAMKLLGVEGIGPQGRKCPRKVFQAAAA